MTTSKGPQDGLFRQQVLDRIHLAGAGIASASSSKPSAGIGRGVRHALARLQQDPSLAAKLKEASQHFVDNVESSASPSSLRKRRAAENYWESLLAAFDASIPPHRFWDEDVVLKYYKHMLYYILIAFSEGGTKGRPKMKSRTLEERCMLFCWAIAKNTRNKAGEATGNRLLISGGIMSELKDQHIMLTKIHGLDRHLDKKLYYGMPELKLLIEEALKNTEKVGRAVGLQRI
ncbi:hypothetical protein BDN70DRAFT_921761 [Pholiota conissans]|uniref:Uncharacterized protein n=1 Tax=Pholiota conissans TaxID=109636 RepID=A0A9P6CSW8_9AGAR|nr:hypothetical protein BDN70DRAFT_921761 [Pholiota conissans]